MIHTQSLSARNISLHGESYYQGYHRRTHSYNSRDYRELIGIILAILGVLLLDFVGRHENHVIVFQPEIGILGNFGIMKIDTVIFYPVRRCLTQDKNIVAQSIVRQISRLSKSIEDTEPVGCSDYRLRRLYLPITTIL